MNNITIQSNFMQPQLIRTLMHSFHTRTALSSDLSELIIHGPRDLPYPGTDIYFLLTQVFGITRNFSYGLTGCDQVGF